MRNVMLAVGLTYLIAACSMSADTQLADQEVPKFHASLNDGGFDALYDAGANELKTAATKQDFVKLLEAVHRKLGNVEKTEKTGWNVNYDTRGTFVTLTYTTNFTRGSGSEQFVYRLEKNRALLVGYHINSNALIVN